MHRHFVRDWGGVLSEIREGRPACVAVMCGVAHGGNLGAVLRTCALLGVPLVVALGGLNRGDVDKAIWSSQLRKRPGWNVTLATPDKETSVTSALEQLRGAGLPLIGVTAHADADSVPLWEADLSGDRIALVFGREKDGIPEEAVPLLGGAVTVPMEVPGTEGSLNVSHAVSLVAYERRRQLRVQHQQPSRVQSRRRLMGLGWLRHALRGQRRRAKGTAV